MQAKQSLNPLTHSWPNWVDPTELTWLGWPKIFGFNHKPNQRSWFDQKTTKKENESQKTDYTPKNTKNMKKLENNESNAKKKKKNTNNMKNIKTQILATWILI